MYEDKKFKEAVVRAIRSYFKGEGYEKYSEVNPKFKYNKKYFDKFEKAHFGSNKDHLEGI